MKLINIILLVTFTINTNLGQSISINYNDVHIGQNISLLFHTKKEKHQFYGGVKYHLNRIAHDNQNNIFRNRFYASNFIEHLGVQVGYNRIIPINNKNNLLIFYDNQLTVSGTRGENFVPFSTIGNTIVYHQFIMEFQKIKALEQNIGIGLNVGLNDYFSVNFKIGGGIAFFWDIPFEFAPNQFYIGKSWDWEFSEFISVGVEYALKKRRFSKK